MNLRFDAAQIIHDTILAVQPNMAVRRALAQCPTCMGKLVLIAIGKAAWPMAREAYNQLGSQISDGIVITKYSHSCGPIGTLRIREAGHPVPDANSFSATAEAMNLVRDLSSEDMVLFLVSGGGSALFEYPLIPEEDIERLTQELLACGADIAEMNTVRKRFSAVKGGRFAAMCNPAHVFSIVLSDVIGDRLDMIASGPAYPDYSTAVEAIAVTKKYNLTLTAAMTELLRKETPKTLNNVTTHISGSVRQLCMAAEKACRELGYEPVILTTSLSCTARDAGVFLGNIAQYYDNSDKKLAFLAGGETVVHLTGHGLGGRNQELALAAAPVIAGNSHVAVFSFGSDGTDGPTDAAGGYVDGQTQFLLSTKGWDIYQTLKNNDAYHALDACGGLLKTGPTGTNVNDLSVVLIDGTC